MKLSQNSPHRHRKQTLWLTSHQAHEPIRLQAPRPSLSKYLWGQWISTQRVDLVSNCPRNGGGDVSAVFLENTFRNPDQTCCGKGFDVVS